jgi:hypothetical protein
MKPEVIMDNPKYGKQNTAYVHECDDADIIICYPRKPTEFEVQMELYQEIDLLCRNLDNGSKVKSEVTVFCDNLRSRFDIMVFRWFSNKAKAMCAVEVKRNSLCSNPIQTAKQNIKYKMIERTGKIPVFYCNGMDDIPGIVKKIGDLIA